MRIKSTVPGRNLLFELSSLVDHQFQDRCHAYISRVYPDVVLAAKMKKVDRMGIDLYQLSAKSDCDFKLAHQCKGFETRFEKITVRTVRQFAGSGQKIRKEN